MIINTTVEYSACEHEFKVFIQTIDQCYLSLGIDGSLKSNPTKTELINLPVIQVLNTLPEEFIKRQFEKKIIRNCRCFE